MKKACIVLPTYNERENIALILRKLLEVFKKIDKVDMNILVVDDNSPDGTADVVEDFTKEHKNIWLLKRERKEGLGKAYIAGFRFAFDRVKADIIFQMDADLSHNPSDIPRFIEEIENSNDFIIGSRYIKKGKIVGWPIHRKIISAGGNFFAKYIAGMYRIHDCTSGFRAIKTSLLKDIRLDKINIHGYAFLIGLLYSAYKKGAAIKEIPITFTEREKGRSKMRFKDVQEFIISCIRMRLKR